MKKRKSNNNSAKKGYGIHNVEQRKDTKKRVRKITKKEWTEISPPELGFLFENGWTTEKMIKKFNQTPVKILNRLRHFF